MSQRYFIRTLFGVLHWLIQEPREFNFYQISSNFNECVRLSLKFNKTNALTFHSSSNIVGATHAHYAWFTKTYGLYSSHDALQVPTLLRVVASVCTSLPTRTQQLPTLLVQQCWELLRLFARSLRRRRRRKHNKFPLKNSWHFFACPRTFFS